MKKENKQIGRRKFIKELGAVVTGALIIPSFTLINPKLIGNNKLKIAKRNPILPPGAVSKNNFNRYCTACHLCVNKCPEKILKPAQLEYGLKGLQHPTIDYTEGFCRFDCMECQICPTGAIKGFANLKEKQQTQIGIAVYNKDFCQINDLGISCRKCFDVCPVKAIKMIDGERKNSLIPSIDSSKCIGCGACEHYCPTSLEKKAIWIDGLENHKKR